jgi:hypothetical protein
MVTFTMNDITHRVTEKGKDNSNLGRWCRTTLRGKNNHLLTIKTAYCPNLPQSGVMGSTPNIQNTSIPLIKIPAHAKPS